MLRLPVKLCIAGQFVLVPQRAGFFSGMMHSLIMDFCGIRAILASLSSYIIVSKTAVFVNVNSSGQGAKAPTARYGGSGHQKGPETTDFRAIITKVSGVESNRIKNHEENDGS